MNKEQIIGEVLREHWGNGTPITYKGKEYRVDRMSYGDYFLEPINWKGGESDGFSDDTLWLVKTEGNPYYYEVEEK